MAEGKTPGTGAASPFGNGQGATEAAGASTGSHDFLLNPKGSGPAGGGRDFTKENAAQKSGEPKDLNPQSVPAGGKLPYPSDKPEPVAVPFRLKG